MGTLTVEGRKFSIEKADDFYSRGKGLMFRKEMDKSSVLWIRPCNSIHTCFMKFSIDIVFLNKKHQVVKAIYNMAPWKLTRPYLSAHSVLEFSSGELPKGLSKGIKVKIDV